MTVFTSPKLLVWGELDVPMFGLQKDWHGVAVEPAAGFSFVSDSERLWFLASHRRPALLHPLAKPGAFQAELWKYDVAEMFLADPVSGRYLEFNLSPNGAWWTGEFTAPRVRAEAVDVAMPEVATFSEMAPDGSWLAAMAVPLDLLKARVNFGKETLINMTMILESPNQRFLTAGDLGSGEVDFHQPEKFPQVRFMNLSA